MGVPGRASVRGDHHTHIRGLRLGAEKQSDLLQVLLEAGIAITCTTV
jgi:hypothetical protein